MSESPDQPGVEVVIDSAPAGVEAAAPAATDDIDTEAFDRAPAPDEEDGSEPATGGEPGAGVPADSPATVDDDHVEIERNGQKFRVPKALEPELLMQADYTRKTQAHAEAVRAWEAERTQQAESAKAFMAEHMDIAAREASLTKIDTDLKAYRSLTQDDWSAIKAKDPAAYQTHVDNYEELRRTRTITEDALSAAKTELKTKETSLTEANQAAEQAKLREAWGQANAVLAKDIPGWGEAKFREIGAFASKEFGITPEQLRDTPDPTAWKMANALMAARAEIARLTTANAQQKTAATTAKAIEVVPPVKPTGGSAAPRGVKDNLGTDDWMSRRNAQVARKRA